MTEQEQARDGAHEPSLSPPAVRRRVWLALLSLALLAIALTDWAVHRG